MKKGKVVPTVIRVTKENNIFQKVEVLKRNRERRNKYQQFVVEGVSPINLAISHGWEIESFLYSGERKLSSWAKEVLTSSKALFHYELSDELMAKLSDKEETSELLAVAYMKKRSLDEIQFHAKSLFLVFDRPHSPGNLGTSIRSANAFGVDGVITTGHAVDAYDPQVIRASVGTFFVLPVYQAASHADIIALRARGVDEGIPLQIVGTYEKGEECLGQENIFLPPTLLVMGNETTGMSKGYRDSCDKVVRLPLSGSLTSLNISCAASIFLYEVARQRGSSFQG